MPQTKLSILYKDELYEFNIGSGDAKTHKLLDNNPDLWQRWQEYARAELTYLLREMKPNTEEQYSKD